MKKRIVFIFSILTILTHAQGKVDRFKVQGYTNIKSDFLYLAQPFGNKNYQFYNFTGGNKIKLSDNGEFLFRGNLYFPSLFLLISDNEVSEYFFLDNKVNQTLNFEKKDRYSIDIKNSDSQTEYLKIKKTIKEVSLEKTLQNKLINLHKKDSVIYQHIVQNPNSFVGLWLLIDGFENNQQNEFQDQSLKLFSSNIKKTILYKVFVEKIYRTALFKNDLSDKIVLKNLNLKDEKFEFNNEKKYILVDFWFSHCAPCLKEMPVFATLYRKYENQGFEIISISTDNKKDISLWKKKIIDLRMDWKNFWDENSKFSTKMGVSKFPTNFLLDGNGKIISQDITSENLEEFLQQNLINQNN